MTIRTTSDVPRLAGAALLSLIAISTGSAVQAQQLVRDPATDPMRCLVVPSRPIEFPQALAERRMGGTVRVRMQFESPDAAPKVEVLYQAANEELVDQVIRFVRQYRLPCLGQHDTANATSVAASAPSPRPGKYATATAVQTFNFEPRAGIPSFYGQPVGTSSGETEPALNCLRTPARALDYRPVDGDYKHDVANVIVQMRFRAANEAPEVSTIYSAASSAFKEAVMAHVGQYRLACDPPEGQPSVMQQAFHLSVRGGTTIFKDSLSLQQFLGTMKHIDRLEADFDFNTMACPFDVAWKLGKPAIANEVAEVGKPDANRTEFLHWLRQLEMDLSSKQFNRLLGQVAQVRIPCGTLKLGPAN